MICAVLRRYSSPAVVADFAAAIETATAAGHEGGVEGQYAAAVVDLDLLAATEAATGGSANDRAIGQLRAALWGRGGCGVIVGIAPATHATTAQVQEALCWTGIDAVLQRWVDGWARLVRGG